MSGLRTNIILSAILVGWGVTACDSIPQPVLDSVEPTSAVAGGPDFTLVIRGSGFVGAPLDDEVSSMVMWNDEERTIKYISEHELHATIPASDIAEAGTARVAVRNKEVGTVDVSARTADTEFLIHPAQTGPAITAIELLPTEQTLFRGNVAYLMLWAVLDDGTRQPYLFDEDISWSSSDIDVATVSEDGFVRGVGSGSSTITATVEGFDASATVNVVTIEALEVTPAQVRLRPGETAQLAARVVTDDGQRLDAPVLWRSSDEDVAAPEDLRSGRILAAGAGSATMTAVLGLDTGAEFTADAAVSVVTIQSLAVSPDHADAEVGEQVSFRALGTFSDGIEEDVTAEVTWSSGNTGVATINPAGIATAVGPGASEIRAVTPEGHVGSASLRVEAPSSGSPTFVYTVATGGFGVFSAIEGAPLTRVGDLPITGNRGLFGAWDGARLWANRSRTETVSGYEIDPNTGLGNRTFEFGRFDGSEGRTFVIDRDQQIAFTSWLVPTGVGAYSINTNPPYFSRLTLALDSEPFQAQDIAIVTTGNQSVVIFLTGGRLNAYRYGDDLQFEEVAGSPRVPGLGSATALVVDPISRCVWIPGFGGLDAFKLEVDGTITPQPGYARNDLDVGRGVALEGTRVIFAEDEDVLRVFDNNTANCGLTETNGSPLATGLGVIRDIEAGNDGQFYVLGSDPNGTPNVDPDLLSAYTYQFESDRIDALGDPIEAGIFATDIVVAHRF